MIYRNSDFLNYRNYDFLNCRNRDFLNRRNADILNYRNSNFLNYRNSDNLNCRYFDVLNYRKDNFLGSRRLDEKRPKESRPFIHPFIMRYLRSRLLICLKQLVGACKRDKNVPPAFLKKFLFCPFWPKTVQNWPFWPKMPKNEGFCIFRNPFIRIG